MICIYAETARSYTGNGLGALTPKAAQVKEAANGSYELTQTHPLDGAGRWRALQENRVVRSPAPSRECPAIEISGGDARTVWRVKPTLPQNWKRANVYSRMNASNSFIISQWRCGAEFALLEQSGSWLRATGPDGVTGYVIREYCEYVRQEPAQESTVIPARRARDQLFRIYDTALDTKAGEITAKARHIFYDLLDCIVLTCDCKGMTVQQALDALSAASTVEHSFHFYTDDTETVIDRDYSLKSIAAAILDPDEGLLHDAGLYLVRDNYDVYLLKAPGKRRSGIRYGRELQGVQLNVNRDKCCNRIIPVGKTKDGKPLLIDGGWVDSPRLTENDRVVTRVIEYDVQVGDKMTAAQAKAKLRELALGEFDRGIDGVDVTLDVRFLFLGDTVEYQQYRELDRVYLYDSVPVTDTLHGVAAETMMTECTYDCLTGRYVGAHFGMTGEQATIGAVQGYELAAGSVTGVKVLRGSLGGYQLQDGAISTPKLQAGAVTADIIAAGAVIAEAIAAGAITAAKIDAGAVNADKIAADAVTAAKIAAGAVTADKIDAGAVTAEKIAAHAITAAQIAAGTITANEIAADAVDAYAVAAVKAEIRRLVAGSITTDQLYTDLAAIAYAQITTANINRANINWASIDSLKAGYAHITDGAIDNADIGFAKIKDLVSGTAIITEGVGGKLYISRLAVDGAQIVELLVNQLYIKNSEGQLQQLTVDAATGKVMGGALLADRSVDAGDILIEHSITASELNVSQIFADQALVGAIKAANIDVANLFASTATVNQLTTWLTKAQTIEALEGSLQLWASDMIDLRVSKLRVGGRNLLRKSQMLTTAAGTGETSADVWRLAGSTAYVYDGDPFNRARLALTGGTEEWGTVIGSPLAKLGDNWQGRQVTFSCWVWSNNWAAVDKGITVSLNLSTGGVARLNYGSKYNIVVPGSVQWGADAGYEQTLANWTWRRFWTTFTLDETTINGGSGTFADNTHMFVHLWLRQNGEVRLYGPQLEWGNIPSDWTPAEEDIDDRVSKTETSLSVLDGEIAAKVDTETFNDLERRVDAAELKITDSAIVSTVRNSTAYTNDLKAKASTDDLTAGLGAKNKVWTSKPSGPYIVGDLWLVQVDDGSFGQGEIYRCKTAATSGFTASHWVKASKYTDDTVANTKITKTTQYQTADSIVQAAEKYTNDQLTGYSTIAQTAESIQASVGELSLGGTQLLGDTQMLTSGNSINDWFYGANTSRYITNGVARMQTALSGATSDNWIGVQSPLVHIGGSNTWHGKKITLSAYVWSDNWAAVDMGIVLTLNMSTGSRTRANYKPKYWIVNSGEAEWGGDGHGERPPANNSWRRMWTTWTLDEEHINNGSGTLTDNTYLWITFGLRRNGDVRYYYPKLEWGDHPTDWSPNPHEFRNSAVTIGLDGIKLETGEEGKITAEVGGEEKLNINKDGVTGSKIVALESLEAPNVVQKATDEAIPWKGGIQASLDAAPKYLNGGGNLIIPAGTYNEDVEITGFVGGQLVLWFINGQVTIRGKITIRYCDHVRFYVIAGSSGSYNLNVVPQKAEASTIEAVCVKRLQLSNMYISGYQGRTSNNNNNVIDIGSSCVLISGCCVEWGYNAIFFANGSTGYVDNCIGGTPGTGVSTKANINRGVSAWSGSHVGINGKVPLGGNSSGSYAAWNASIVGTATGTAGDGTVPTPSVYTKTYAITKHCTYIIGDSRIRDDQSQLLSQGRYGAYAGTGTSGWRKGVMWFDGLSGLAGKTIQSATLTLYRGAGGNGGSANVNVYATTLASGSYASTTDPGLTGTAVTQAVGREAEASFDVTALVKTAISSAKYGLAVYEAPNSYVTGWSYGYAQIYGMGSQHPPVLTVTYK